MNAKTLAAALNIAYAVARVDGIEDAETSILVKEIQSFKLDEAQRERVLALYKEMNAFEAISIIRESSDADKNEAGALAVLTLTADGEWSDQELGAIKLMAQLCGFKAMGPDEAHQVLGF